MPDLTPEEKQKIYAEEKARLEAQEKLKKEQQAKQSKNLGIGCLVIIIIGIILAVIFNTTSGPKSSGPREEITLNAAVRFTGTQFVISNNDSFDWKDVKIEINSGLIKGGYEYKTGLIEAKKTYTIGAALFAKSDGTRFNPFVIKPQNVTISATTPSGRAYYTGSWE